MRSAGVKWDMISLSSAMSACQMAKQWQEAVSFLDCMRWAAVSPTALTYNVAISACHEAGPPSSWEK
eukprot:2297922-Karenia_brevis.AAC.1